MDDPLKPSSLKSFSFQGINPVLMQLTPPNSRLCSLIFIVVRPPIFNISHRTLDELHAIQ